MFSHAVQRYHSQAASSQNITKDDTSSDNVHAPGNKSYSRRLPPILILIVSDWEIQLSFSRQTQKRWNQIKHPKQLTKPTEMLQVSFKPPCTHSGLINIAYSTVCNSRRSHPAAARTIQNSEEACFGWTHTSVSPFPFSRSSFQPQVWNRLQIPPLWLAYLTTSHWPRKGVPTALALCANLNASKQRTGFIWHLTIAAVRKRRKGSHVGGSMDYKKIHLKPE